MKKGLILLAILFTMLSNQGFSQSKEKNFIHFISIFKSELKKYDIGDIEEHFEDAYFRTKSESQYFDKEVEIGLTTLYQRCSGKNNNAIKEEIKIYFEQFKHLKNERASLNKEILDFSSIKDKLKIRMYANNLKDTYIKHDAIIKEANKGIIEIIVVDLPTGIGSLGSKYLKHWGISIDSVYNISKINTLKDIKATFIKIQPDQNGMSFNLLADDYDLYVTSSVLDLGKFNTPQGKYGTIISIPNSSMVIAKTLDDKNLIEQNTLEIMGATDAMFNLQNVKPISSNLFWYYNDKFEIIEKDYDRQTFIYPIELQKKINK